MYGVLVLGSPAESFHGRTEGFREAAAVDDDVKNTFEVGRIITVCINSLVWL